MAAIGSALTALIRPSLAPFTIAFALAYGLLTDGFIFILRVKSSERDVRAYRLIAALTMSTVITGMASYYIAVHIPALLPRNHVLEAIVLAVGVISGLAGGFLGAPIWRKALRHTVAISSSKAD